MQKIKNILLDLDGTLTDSKSSIGKSIQYALDKMGKPIPTIDKLVWAIGPPLSDVFMHLLETKEADQIQEAIDYYRSRYVHYCVVESKPYAGIHGTLATLVARQYHLYLATSKPRIYAKKILMHFKLDHYFKQLYGSELDGRHDYKKELIQYILQAHHLNPKYTVMIGDRHYDIGGAHHNHIRSVAVRYGYGTHDELMAAGPDYICKHHREWLSILKGAYVAGNKAI